MRKPFRRKIKTKTGQKEYDGLIRLRIPMPRDIRDEIQRAADRRKGAIDARVSKAREWAAKVLRGAGLPDTLRTVQRHQDGTWTELPKDLWAAVDALPDGESIKTTNVLGLVYAQKPVHDLPDGWWDWPDDKIEEYFDTLPPLPVDIGAPTNGRELSLEWHACQILERIASLEAALANGDPQWLVLAGMELAEAWHHAIFTERHELPAAIGLASLGCGPDGAAGGRQGLSEEELADIQRQADAIRRLNPGWSNAKVAEAIKNKHGRAERTIRRYLENPSKASR